MIKKLRSISFLQQVMEMAFAGWRFFVLSPAFAIHWGFHNEGYKTNERKREVRHNFLHFKTFLEEKLMQYKDKNGNFQLMYMNNEAKKIYENVQERISFYTDFSVA